MSCTARSWAFRKLATAWKLGTTEREWWILAEHQLVYDFAVSVRDIQERAGLHKPDVERGPQGVHSGESGGGRRAEGTARETSGATGGCGCVHYRGIQPEDAVLLDVYDGGGAGGADGGADGADRGSGGGGADDLCSDDGSHPRIRNTEGHGRDEPVLVSRTDRTSGVERGIGLWRGDDRGVLHRASE